MDKFNKNTVYADIEKIRGAITALQEEASWIETSKPPKADLIARMNKWVDALGNESDSVRRVMYDDDSRDIFKVATKIDFGGHGRSANLGPLLCELFADPIKNTLGKKIEQLDYEPGPAWADRPRLLEKNAMQVKQLEIAEESLICEAEKVGLPIPRREDLSPEVFLEVDLSQPLPDAPESAAAIEYRDRQAALMEMADRDQANSARLVGSRGAVNFDLV
ncbi:hypothetical protein [Methylotuvimicrobium sp. KM1]|uniref:hypothetical protein n=1 Tax=Methylotuvimicrobium sp. KM1 TaxID=3377707 RepID=UPI00384CE7F6